MTKAIASIGTGPQRRLLDLARRTFAPYARRHGYDLHLRTEPLGTGRPAPWDKVRLLHDLAGSYETVVWLDADLVIVDGRRDLAAELGEGKLLGLVEHRLMPNTGVMVLRGGEEARAFLDEVWAQERFVDHRWWENAAICHLLGYELEGEVRRVGPTAWTDRVALLDPRWNSIPDDPARRPRIRHFPGYKTRTRAVLMAGALGEAALRAAAGRW